MVSHFHHSVVASEALKQKLINSCVSQWNSTYEMLNRLLKLQWHVAAVLSNSNITKACDRYLDLNFEQWKLL